MIIRSSKVKWSIFAVLALFALLFIFSKTIGVEGENLFYELLYRGDSINALDRNFEDQIYFPVQDKRAIIHEHLRVIAPVLWVCFSIAVFMWAIGVVRFIGILVFLIGFFIVGISAVTFTIDFRQFLSLLHWFFRQEYPVVISLVFPFKLILKIIGCVPSFFVLRKSQTWVKCIMVTCFVATTPQNVQVISSILLLYLNKMVKKTTKLTPN